MPFVFTISKTPSAGDIVSVTLTDGAGHEEVYSYTVILGNTLQNISDAVKALINADIYFTAIDQTTYPSEIGLEINQITNTHYNLFTGSVQITYIKTEDAVTISFDEDNNAFESFLGYHPDYMCTIGTLLVSSKNGDFYTHDSDIYNNFYEEQQESSLTLVFNDKVAIKKTFDAVGYQSNKIWASPTNGDIITSMTNPQTNLPQISKLTIYDYVLEEETWTAGYLRDANSLPNPAISVFEGDFLKGTYLKHKFICALTDTTGVVYFLTPYLHWSVSSRNF